MVRNRYLPRTGVGLALQGLRLLAAYPQFEVKSRSHQRAVWRGTLQPTELSDVYTVEIDYTLSRSPDVHVLDPQLKLHPDHKRLPHVYPGNRLCLYTFGEWYPGLYIANTIVPWISLWLFFYEIWLLTGKWKGGGAHPQWSQHRNEGPPISKHECGSMQADFSLEPLREEII